MREKIVKERRLCLSFLLLGHWLSTCHSRKSRKVQNCNKRYRTLLHEVYLKLIERARVKNESETLPDGERNQAAAPREGESTLRLWSRVNSNVNQPIQTP